MLPKLLLGLSLLASSAVAYPGLLHDEPHHTHEVLENIHNTPHCAYTCIFDENMPRKWAPECDDIVGLEFGACLCRADPYQYMLDQCVDLRCKKTEDRKKARETNVKNCAHYGVKEDEMYKLEDLDD